jgi:hypothetical protein
MTRERTLPASPGFARALRPRAGPRARRTNTPAFEPDITRLPTSGGRGLLAARRTPTGRPRHGTGRRGQIRAGRFQSGQMGQTVNLVVLTFGGSNPPLPTTTTAHARCASAVGVSSHGNATGVARYSTRQSNGVGRGGSERAARSLATVPSQRALARTRCADHSPGRSKPEAPWRMALGACRSRGAGVVQW